MTEIAITRVNNLYSNKMSASSSSSIKQVQIGIEFVRIGEIDNMNEKYQAEIRITANWHSNENIITYDPKVNWNPLLYIENMLTKSEEQTSYEVESNDDDGQTVKEIKIIKGVFWERLELQNFPLDVQELSITVISKRKNEINFIYNKARISHINMDASNTFIDQQKWKLYKQVKIRDYASYEIPNYRNQIENENELKTETNKNLFSTTKISAVCYCSRRPGYYFSNAFFLIFLITISSLTIFSIDPKLPQNRLQNTFTLLLTSISFKWVINRSLPTVAYLTSLDKYAIISIFYLCWVCIWHALVGSFWDKDTAKDLDKWLLITFAVIFLLIQIILIIWIIRAYSLIHKLSKEEKSFVKKYHNSQVNIAETKTTI